MKRATGRINLSAREGGGLPPTGLLISTTISPLTQVEAAYKRAFSALTSHLQPLLAWQIIKGSNFNHLFIDER